jgi:hypothetical protein
METIAKKHLALCLKDAQLCLTGDPGKPTLRYRLFLMLRQAQDIVEIRAQARYD